MSPSMGYHLVMYGGSLLVWLVISRMFKEKRSLGGAALVWCFSLVFVGSLWGGWILLRYLLDLPFIPASKGDGGGVDIFSSLIVSVFGPFLAVLFSIWWVRNIGK